MRNFKVGEQIVYPNHGVGTIEKIEEKQIGDASLAFYILRLSDKSQVFVPVKNAGSIGLREPISSKQCELLLSFLAEDFDNAGANWKIRSRQFSEQMKTGDVFEVADILKKLTFLNRAKPLSFREGKMLEKVRHLIVSEITAVCRLDESKIEKKVEQALTTACAIHDVSQTKLILLAASA